MLKRSKLMRKPSESNRRRLIWNRVFVLFTSVGFVVFSILATFLSFVSDDRSGFQTPSPIELLESVASGGILGICLGSLSYYFWIHKIPASTQEKLPYLRQFINASFGILCVFLAFFWILVPISWSFLKLLTVFATDLNIHLIVFGFISLIAAMVGGGISVALLWARNRSRYGGFVLGVLILISGIVFTILAVMLSYELEDGLKWGWAAIAGAIFGIALVLFISWAWINKIPDKWPPLLGHFPRSACACFFLALLILGVLMPNILDRTQEGVLLYPFNWKLYQYMIVCALGTVLAGLLGGLLFTFLLVRTAQMSDPLHKMGIFLTGITGAFLVCIWAPLIRWSFPANAYQYLIQSGLIIVGSGILLLALISKREEKIAEERNIKRHKMSSLDVFVMSLAAPGILIAALNNNAISPFQPGTSNPAEIENRTGMQEELFKEQEKQIKELKELLEQRD